MAFKGDLKNISLFDIFQTLTTNNQSGVLVLQREGTTKKLFFSPQGIRIFFTRSFRPLHFGEIFVRRGFLNSKDVEILLLEQKKQYRPIGQMLVESGKVPAEEVQRVLHYHAEDEIFELFGWNAGTFAFFDGEMPDESSATPLSEALIDPAGLCLEAARRLDEMERIRVDIPNDDEFYVRAHEGEVPETAVIRGVPRAVLDALRAPY
ncbi:MAG: DUF4388 domain-containing protein, partial [Planctomycetota bacterium]